MSELLIKKIIKAVFEFEDIVEKPVVHLDILPEADKTASIRETIEANAMAAINKRKPGKNIKTVKDLYKVLNSEDLTEEELADINADIKAAAAIQADAVTEVLGLIEIAGDDFFKDTDWREPTKESGFDASIGYPIYKAMQKSDDPRVQAEIVKKFNQQFLDEHVMPILEEKLAEWPKILNGATSFLYLVTSVAGKTKRISRPDIGGLQAYLTNVALNLKDTPAFIYGVPAQQRGEGQSTDFPVGPPAGQRIKREIAEAVGEQESEEQYLIDYDKDSMKHSLESAGMSKEQIDKILSGMDIAIETFKKMKESRTKKEEPITTEVEEILKKGATATMHKKARYNVVNGQEVNDQEYGKGVVVATTNLESGFVSVAFGPNMVVDNYDAEKIVQPTFEEIPTFECPMDNTVIVADTCMGALPQEACPFLQFINDVPKCGFLNTCKQQRDNQCACKEQKIAASKQNDEKYASKLNELLKTSSFTDHDYFQIVENVPVDVNGLVKKRSASMYGRVIERHADSSLTVKWNNGTETLSWESELQGIDSETGLKLKDAGVI
jgi:hypothetical protein